ncbi:hypothetical protein AB1Y20_014866 [Prymnesium parvum]|uniref:Pentacotripeptide-repeat region of PRORP domain-containing protein n=1 Tax=Prymnesium parvum TaxID=97485 RepID=A0AB34JYQ9_PRYPA
MPRRVAGVSAQRALKRALRRVPSHELTIPTVGRYVERYAPPSSPHGLLASLDAVCLDAVIGKRRRADLALPLLEWAHERASARGGGSPHRVFNAAIRGLAYSGDASAHEVAEAVFSRMTSLQLPVSAYTLQGLLRTARGEGTQPLRLLASLMERSGTRPNIAAFNQLLGAISRQPHAAAPPLLTFSKALPALRLKPNGCTLIEFTRLASSADDLAFLEPLITASPHRMVRDAFLLSQARLHRTAATRHVLALIQRADAMPPPHVMGQVVLATCKASEPRVSLEVLKLLWQAHLSIGERSALQLMHAAGELAARDEARRAAAHDLLRALEAALFGGGVTAMWQRGGWRRSETAEHEATCTLARSFCRAGLLSAADASQLLLDRLERAGVRPRLRALATCVFLHADKGDFQRALQLVEELTRPDPAQAQLSSGRRTLWLSENKQLTETPFLSVLAAVRSTAHLPHALMALQLMAAAGVAPTLRTRLAICKMAIRLKNAHLAAGDGRRLPGSARFWKAIDADGAPPMSSLVALRQAGVDVHDAADFALEARAAAILDRIASLIHANGSGRALSALISRRGVRK